MTPDDLRAWQAAMGYTYDTAAAALGVNRSTVLSHLVNAAMMTKGERRALSEARRSEVLRLRGEGLSFAEAARIVGISETWARASVKAA